MEDDVIHDLSAGFALDALGRDDERTFETHLATCVRCQEDLAEFAQVVTALAYAVPASETPAALRGRVLAATRVERVVEHRWFSRRPLPVGVAVAALACSALIGLGVGLAALHRGSKPNGATLRALPLTRGSGALVRASSGEATLVVSGISPAPAGMTYEAWVVIGDTSRRAGLFTARAPTTSIHLTRRVPAGAVVTVTLERAGGSDRPGGKPIVVSARV